MARKAIFLDRDGVINYPIIKNGKPFPPRKLSELKVYAEVPSFLKLMKSKGFYLIVITNQPDVARGDILKFRVEEINKYLFKTLVLDDIKVCYHDDSDNCDCRKPLPGSLIAASKLYNLELENCYMIGDRWKDISAGLKAGCKTIFIDRNYNEKKPKSYHVKIRSLDEARDYILKDMLETSFKKYLNEKN